MASKYELQRTYDRALIATAIKALERKDTKSAADAVAAMSPEGRVKALRDLRTSREKALRDLREQGRDGKS